MLKDCGRKLPSLHSRNPRLLHQKRLLFVSVALPAEPRGEKKLFFVQILGGEKTFKIW